MTDWLAVLRAIAPKGKTDILEQTARYLPGTFAQAEINTPIRQAHFLAQLAHESAGFRTTVEYASGAAYEGRKDLGNTQPGDGKRYRGRGLIQLTGRANYREAGADLDIDLEGAPDRAAEFPAALDVSGWFWNKRGLNRFADADDVRAVTRRINGGYNGLADREQYLAKAKKALRSTPAAASAPETFVDRARIKAVQEKLVALGYHMVGKPDGVAGPRTAGAIAAFEAENGFPVAGEINQLLIDRLEEAEPHEPSPERATGVPADSRIVKEGSAVKQAGLFTAVTGVVTSAEPILAQAESTKGILERIKAVTTPLRDLLADHWPILLLAAGAILLWQGSKIVRARVEDYRLGRVP